MFHQVTGITNNIRQDKNGETPEKQVSDLWFKTPETKEIGQGHNFHDFELMQDEYWRNLDKIEPMDEGSDIIKWKTIDIYKRNQKLIKWK